jgi:hypothetical protein
MWDAIKGLIRGNNSATKSIECDELGNMFVRQGKPDMVAVEQKTQADLDENGKIVFSDDMDGLRIYNDSETDNLTYVVGTFSSTLKPGESDSEAFAPFDEVTITQTTPMFRIRGLR